MLESGMSALARALRGDLGLDDDDCMITTASHLFSLGVTENNNAPQLMVGK
jgi:hypothetical protein